MVRWVGMVGGCDSNKPSFVEWVILIVMIIIIITMISGLLLNIN